MSDPGQRSAKDIFSEAADLPPDQRRAFVESACAGDPALLSEVLSLLAHLNDSTEFLSPHDFAQLSDSFSGAAGPQPGDVIGRYTLRERLGAGGMGEVWRAEQTEPITREVALKLIKPGMDTREVVARFMTERQTLALLDHPNIARVFDAGATPAGHPYFVMELVRGAPVTTYCDDHRLSTRHRLELFLTICDAVHYAHQKGVIHRD
ncbi:MAG: protein kinase, partial [Planctomycetota bacterium]|nr:protein kinase [Planctomycetota bacterium]